MKYAYALLGLVFIGIGIAVSYLQPHAAVAPPHSIMSTSTTLSLTSPAFENKGSIPSKYTCDENRFLSPPLAITGVPAGTKSLALIMDDPDVPKNLIPSGVFVHWVLYNIPPETREIPEGESVGTAGGNGRDELSYTGPCPPDREHRYFFTLYALSRTLNFGTAPTKDELEQAMQGMIIEQTQVMGTYERKH